MLSCPEVEAESSYDLFGIIAGMLCVSTFAAGGVNLHLEKFERTFDKGRFWGIFGVVLQYELTRCWGRIVFVLKSAAEACRVLVVTKAMSFTCRYLKYYTIRKQVAKSSAHYGCLKRCLEKGKLDTLLRLCFFSAADGDGV